MELEIAGSLVAVVFAARRAWGLAEVASASSVDPSLVSDHSRPLGDDVNSGDLSSEAGFSELVPANGAKLIPVASYSAAKRRCFWWLRRIKIRMGTPLKNAALFRVSLIIGFVDHLFLRCHDRCNMQ